MPNMKLTKFLTSPSKVANALDWKRVTGSVLALNISREAIGLTLASHPSAGPQTSRNLDSIPLKFVTKNNKRSLDPSVIAELNNVVHHYKVCGFVVNWPLQKEGRLGASCGRVLHVLDHLTQESETPILSSNRKFCLWDGSHVQLEKDDSFGRCEIYGRPSTSDDDFVHVASREQYDQKREIVDIWNDFCVAHWPELCENGALNGFNQDGEWLEDFEQDRYAQASVL